MNDLKRTFNRNVAVLAGGAALGQLAIVLVSPVLTRLYSPEEFGLLAVYMAMVSIFATIASLRFEVAIPLAADDETAASLIFVSTLLASFFCAALALIAYFHANEVSNAINTPGLKNYLWVVPVCTFGASLYQISNFWAIRKKAFTLIAQTRLLQNLSTCLLQVGLGIFQFGPLGLLGGDAIGRLFSGLNFSAIAFRNEVSAVKQVTLKSIQGAIIRFRRFPLFSGSAALLNVAGLELPLIAMSVLYGPSVVGWLALANRVLGMPLNLVTSSVSQVYLGDCIRTSKEDPEKLLEIFYRTIRNMVYIATPYTIGLAIISPVLFPVVFGAAWQSSGQFTQILAVMFLLQAVASPTGGTLDALERQDLHLIREVIRIVIIGIVFLTAAIIRPEPVWAIAMLAAGGVVSSLAYLLISLQAIRSFLSKRDSDG